MTYKTIPLGKLRKADSGIHVKVEAMPLSVRSDDGGFICSLAREGDIVTASFSEVVYDLLIGFPGVYHFTGKWNGKKLEVHDAVAEPGGLFPPEEEHEPAKPMYSDSSSYNPQDSARRKYDL